MRTLSFALCVLCCALTCARSLSQQIQWDQTSISHQIKTDGQVARVSFEWGEDLTNLLTRAYATVYSGDNPAIPSSAEVDLLATQTGRITSLGSYNSVRVYGGIYHYADAQITFVYGSLTQFYHSEGKVAVTSHNGASYHSSIETSNYWYGVYMPADGPKLLLDLTNWDGTPIGLRRESRAHPKASRTGLNLLSERVETTAIIIVQGYNR